MRSACNLFKKFLADEQGLETVEYAVIAGLILIGAITAIGAVGYWVQIKFEKLAETLEKGAP